MPPMDNDYYAFIGRAQTLNETLKLIINRSGKLKNEKLDNDQKKNLLIGLKELSEDGISLIEAMEKYEKYNSTADAAKTEDGGF